MSSKGQKSVIFLTVLIVSAFSIVIGEVLYRSSLTTSSEAQNVIDLPYCPVNVSISVRELFNDGHEEILDLDAHPETNEIRWGFADDLHLADSFIGFNGIPLLEYQSSSSELSFIQLPGEFEVYEQGDKTSIQLFYDRNVFEVVKKEIHTCTAGGTWLCADSEATESVNKISGITMQCGMELDLGWTVKKKGISVQEIDTDLRCDLNSDSVCNTFDLFLVIDQYGRAGTGLTGDANSDGKVNSLDYSIVARVQE